MNFKSAVPSLYSSTKLVASAQLLIVFKNVSLQSRNNLCITCWAAAGSGLRASSLSSQPGCSREQGTVCDFHKDLSTILLKFAMQSAKLITFPITAINIENKAYINTKKIRETRNKEIFLTCSYQPVPSWLAVTVICVDGEKLYKFHDKVQSLLVDSWILSTNTIGII